MAIDKITPKLLNTDRDERSLEQGMMTDAGNVTVSEGGKGTSNILKNVKGTVSAEPFALSDKLANAQDIDAQVIGQVSDSHRGYIYFFVADFSEKEDHSIYQYNVKTDKYRVVLRDTRLAFSEEYYIKADVVNSRLGQGAELQTLLYFTDNVNQPRKINVDRALIGEYDGLDDAEWEYSVNCIKAAPVLAPSTEFTTTTSLPHNNFQNEAFQFATQVIYKDGEESAISPYSKIAFSERLAFYGIDESSTDDSLYQQVTRQTDNTCLISLNLLNELANANEVSRVRIIAREGNTGGFYTVDEFDPQVVLFKSVYGQNITVYDPTNGQYKFFNDILGAFISETDQNKLYDNVPFKARAQAVVGNRIMYANYTEGRPNTKTSVELNVKYLDDSAAENELINQSIEEDFPTFNGIEGDQYFVFNLEYPFIDLNADTIIDAGSHVSMTFNIANNTFSVSKQDGDEYMLRVNMHNYSGDYGVTSQTDLYFDIASATMQPIYITQNLVEVDFIVPYDCNIEQLKEVFADQISNASVIKKCYGNGSMTQTENTQDTLGEYAQSVGDLDFDLQWSGDPDLPNTKNLFECKIGFDAFVREDGKIQVDYTIDDIKLIENDNPANVLGITDQNGNNQWLPDQPFEEASFFTTTQPSVLFVDNPLSQQGIGDRQTSLSIIDLNVLTGFKSGSLHRLGVVYYDRFNRSGFVNDIGTFYAGWYNDHSRLLPGVTYPVGAQIEEDDTNSGPAAININFLSDPPDWAETFQIVYPGRSSMDAFTQYTVGSAFPARKGDIENVAQDVREVDQQSKRIYVSLETLDRYRDEKNTLRDYSFTEGDKLRVVSIGSFNGGPDEVTTAYPSASDGSIIEFDVIGVELLAKTGDNPIAYNVADQSLPIGNLTDIADYHVGKFLVLEASEVSGGANGNNGDQLKYKGFDWYSVASAITGTDFNYPDSSGPEAVNRWEKRCVVEVYSPKKSTANEFYYEIGEVKRVIDRSLDLDEFGADSYHGPAFTVYSGDVHYRPVACKTVPYEDLNGDGNNQFGWDYVDDWLYVTKLLESSTVSDILAEDMWSKGRPHTEFERAATIRRFNGITYSDAYEEDVAKLSLASFNLSLANFGSLEAKYGAANYIENYGNTGELLAIQENKLSITDVNKNILFDAAGGGNISLSTNVLNSTRYFVGDYGCGDHPESVLVYNNDVFFADAASKRIIRFAGGQIVPISDKGVASLVNDAFDEWSTATSAIIGTSPNKPRKIVSGYDPDDDVYYITFFANRFLSFRDGGVNENLSITKPGGQFYGYTLGYNVALGSWQSKYSFVPTIYANQNNTMYSAKYVFNDNGNDPALIPLIFHKHVDEGSNKTTFYSQATSEFFFDVVSNSTPSQVKVYDAISYEGSANILGATIISSDGGNGTVLSFDSRENAFYAPCPRDVGANSTASYSCIGFCTDVEDSKIILSKLPVGVPIPKGAQIMTLIGGQLIDLSGNQLQVTTVEGVGGKEVFASISDTTNALNNSIIIRTNAATDGNAIRGHYATIKMNGTSSTEFEVFCVNAHATASLLSHV